MNFVMIILNQNIKTCKTMLYGYWKFIIHIKTEAFYKDIVDDVKKNYEVDRLLDHCQKE